MKNNLKLVWIKFLLTKLKLKKTFRDILIKKKTLKLKIIDL